MGYLVFIMFLISALNGEFQICDTWENQSHPWVIYDGGKFFVFWIDSRNNYFGDIYGTPLSTEGEPLWPCGKLLVRGMNGYFLNLFGVSSSDGTYLLHYVFSPYQFINNLHFFSRVREDGTPLDSEGIFMGSNSIGPACGGVASTSLFLPFFWKDLTLYGWIVDPSQGPVDSLPIPLTPPNSYPFANVSAKGRNFFVVWSGVDSLGNDIFCMRIREDGEAVDPYPKRLTNNGSTSMEKEILISQGSSCFLVVFNSQSEGGEKLWGLRISFENEILDTLPFLILRRAPSQFSICYVPGVFYLFWQEEGDIYFTRILESGRVVDPEGIPFKTSEREELSPSPSFDGERLLVVFEVKREEDSGIYGEFLKPSPVKERETTSKVVVSPNPFSTFLTIRGAEGANSAKVFDINGRLVKVINLESGIGVWRGRDMRGRKIRRGVYFIEIGKIRRKVVFMCR